MTDPAITWSLFGLGDWSFQEFVASDTTRAVRLEQAGSPTDLVEALVAALGLASKMKALICAWEFSEDRPLDCRAVVQFRVEPTLFDWFFNARTGYRAHYRTHPTYGIEFNAAV